MNRPTILIATLIAALLSSLAWAQIDSPQTQQHHDFDRMLKRLDKNSDGKISRDEWIKKSQAFDRLDLDHDSFLTADEAKSAFRQRAERGESATKAFAAMDKSNDGQVSRDEWTGKPKLFDRLDLDHSGAISR
ncbi:MAG: EF-hand domain-containing protein, partial [Acidobacteriales bacterium]|nr:EF-hand domain-containing protein [Terriglobales bacterium]